MKEREVRQLIEGFLKRTARELVVPASVGLGLALSGCDHTGIRVSRDAAADIVQSASPDAIVADAGLGRESAATSPDTVSPPDLRLPEDTGPAPDARQADLPVIMPPYMVFIPPDAASPDARVDAPSPDVRTDAGFSDARVDTDRPEAGLDADARDAEAGAPDARADVGAPDVRPDARQADLPIIVPPYIVAPLPDAARDLPAVMPPYMPPPPPYMAPSFAPPPPPPAPPPPPPPIPVYMGASFGPPPPPPSSSPPAPPATVLPAKTAK